MIVRVIKIDNKIVTVKEEVKKKCTALLIRIKPSTPDA
jgi:hypothetical protein